MSPATPISDYRLKDEKKMEKCFKHVKRTFASCLAMELEGQAFKNKNGSNRFWKNIMHKPQLPQGRQKTVHRDRVRRTNRHYN